MEEIILPIKPQYAEAILSGEKKYEYRKKLCKKDIEKIYIYATSPVKKVIGEVRVISKLEDTKERLWKKTGECAGVSYDEYCAYFQKESACAYELGEPVRYERPKLLKEFGINFYPQTYVYISQQQ